MRKKLEKLNGQRRRFQGRFVRFGTKHGWRGRAERTVLLADLVLVDDPENILTDHIWFTCGKTFDRLHLHPGDLVVFDARVAPYEKGYQGRRAEELGLDWYEVDYHLERPTKAIKGELVDLPDPTDDTVYVTSTIVAQAAARAGRTDVYSPAELVRDGNGTVIGCRGLQIPN
ncbi:hypothetical protein IW967_11610 [Alicyclobacillus mali]|uniref:Uncharacterized protein n=1 Tax=Alicyclobacillus mali (ex Roth et al. 2021) TaxID=1123961 RepID=A0ABS0F5C8_9BACL|nr:hypothetical protein [Alicyclobacillus mali (ex Roth et al. 2021)]MBF8378501.1 hypothetical protein [Alicyclobacillus mali (ex Roth et al. 2021)]